MNHCDICDVDIVGNHSACPLCKNNLNSKYKRFDNIFPKIPTIYEENKKLFKWLGLISVIVAIINVFINILVTPKIWWSMFVILGLLSCWGIIYYAVNRQSNLIKYIFWQSIIIAILCILWDYSTHWHNWSIDFVLPILFSVGNIATVLITKVLKMSVKDGVLYVILNVLLGFVPAIFLMTKHLNVTVPSLISIMISQTLLVTLIILEGKNIVNELKKRLHM